MTDSPKPTYKSFEEFWPVYLAEHASPQTRQIHVVATLLAALFLVIGILTLKLGWIILAALVGYGGAWAAHAFIENNQPSTFSQPLLSLRGDVKMIWLFFNGKLNKELADHHVQ